jgi:hypothetical protein
MLNEIIHERREKLQILYLRLEELKNEIKEREEELKYFEKKLVATSKLVSQFTGLD